MAAQASLGEESNSRLPTARKAAATILWKVMLPSSPRNDTPCRCFAANRRANACEPTAPSTGMAQAAWLHWLHWNGMVPLSSTSTAPTGTTSMGDQRPREKAVNRGNSAYSSGIHPPAPCSPASSRRAEGAPSIVNPSVRPVWRGMPACLGMVLAHKPVMAAVKANTSEWAANGGKEDCGTSQPEPHRKLTPQRVRIARLRTSSW